MTDRSRLLSASLATQEKWLDENYPDHLLDAHNDSELGWLIIGLEEEMAEYIASVQFGDAIGEVIYNTATDLSLVRVNQIDGGAPLTDGEKEVLRAHIIEVELDSFGGTHMANACTYVEFEFEKHKIFSVYYGLIEGQGGYNPKFAGIFKSISAAEMGLADHGHFVNDHLLKALPNKVQLSQALLDCLSPSPL
jgi:hypothetical protein